MVNKVIRVILILYPDIYIHVTVPLNLSRLRSPQVAAEVPNLAPFTLLPAKEVYEELKIP